MLYIIAFEEGGKDAACTERIGFESNEEKDRR
jgi:hypothetical protein